MEPDPSPGGLHYLRIPKTGSSSLLAMLAWARNHSKTACEPLHVHSHDVLPRHLPARAPSFVVLREPCSRFASAYDFVRRPDAVERHLHPDDVVHTFEDGASGAIRWASLMLHDQRYANKWRQHTSVGPALALNQTMPHVIAWQQNVYVGSNTQAACLPRMREEVQRILLKTVPGCVLPPFDIRKNEGSTPNPARPTPELCTLVEALYPSDVRLWAANCLLSDEKISTR